jgi:hypothetical protein
MQAQDTDPAAPAQTDRLQALELIAVPLEEAPDALLAAHRALHARGEGLARKLRHPLEQRRRSEAALVGRSDELAAARQ